MLIPRRAAAIRVRSATAGSAAAGRLAAGSLAGGALALGSLAVGALAAGSVAIGRLAIGRADLRRVRIARLEVGELVLRRPGYGFGVTLDAPYDEVVERVRAALADQGFGVLTEIDVAATLRTELGVEVPPQVVLGACNPPLAHRGLQAEPDLGLLLPCNVVVRADEAGATRVTALDPQVMVGVTGRPELEAVAEDARARLRAVLDALGGGQESSASRVTNS